MVHLDDALLRRALEVGRTLDLSDCFYDPTRPTGGAASRECPPYYALLAGLVRVTGARTVVELGTHYGGATLAMARGFQDPAAGRIVTLDVTAMPNPHLESLAAVRRVQGDVFSADTLGRTLRALEGRAVDLMFLDIVHGYHQTKRALGLYANRLQPELIALDDVDLNGGMRLLWRELRAAWPAIDPTALVEREAAGFGLLQPPRPMQLDEGEPWRAAVWGLRRAVAARTPRAVKRGVTALLDALPGAVRKRLDPS